MIKFCGFRFPVYLVSVAFLVLVPSGNTQAISSQYDLLSPLESQLQSQRNWDGLGLYALLSQTDGQGGHPLARKSVRSPSRRLRFGRRSDPAMPPVTPLEEMEQLLALRETRTPVRLRFGRSEEHAVPHFFPQEDQERDVRSPSMRLRFGRSDNNMYVLPYESTLPKDVKANAATEDDKQQD